jgi:hypothetical protein
MAYNETPTKGLIMSKTMKSSTSILTTAMENVRAKKNAVSDPNTTPSFEAENTRFKKIAGAAAVGCTALITAAILISNRVDDRKAAEAGIIID